MKSLMRLWAFSLIVTYFATLLVPAVALAVTAPPPSCSISITPSVIEAGGSATLKWTSTNATGGAITNVGNVGPSGNTQILPPTTSQVTTYIGSFTGPGGTANCTASVQISYGNASGSGDSGAFGGSGSDRLADPNPTPINSGTTYINTSGGTQGALVQCGIGAGIGNSTSCQACNLAQLVQNIINFCIGLSIPIAAVLFAWAGILYFTSGANPTNKETAKKIFSSALIGFLIAITSWLVINTLLHVLLKQSEFPNSSWFSIQCSSNRPVTGNINDVLKSILPGVMVAPPGLTAQQFNDRLSGLSGGGGGPTASCPDGFTLNNGTCENNYDPSYTVNPTYSNAPLNNAQMSQQIADACAQYGMSSAECAWASNIAMNESGGGNNCTTSRTGAAGCMQVLATTACGLDPSIDGCAACSASRQSTSAVCAQVIQTISGNTQLGTNLGIQYYNQMFNMFGGSCQLAAAAYFQGPGAVRSYGGVPPVAAGYAARACR